MTVFPIVSDERRLEMLSPQPGRARVIIDTDAENEIDDQFAMTWALLSPDRLEVEAIVAEPFSWAHVRETLLEAAAAFDRDFFAKLDDQERILAPLAGLGQQR